MTHPVTEYWYRANQSLYCSLVAVRQTTQLLNYTFFSRRYDPTGFRTTEPTDYEPDAITTRSPERCTILETKRIKLGDSSEYDWTISLSEICVLDTIKRPLRLTWYIHFLTLWLYRWDGLCCWKDTVTTTHLFKVTILSNGKQVDILCPLRNFTIKINTSVFD